MIHARSDYNRIQDPEGLIGEDGPVFLLRGKDMLAPATLDFWASLVESVDKGLADSVRNFANHVREWQLLNTFKFPDTPNDERWRS